MPQVLQEQCMEAGIEDFITKASAVSHKLLYTLPRGPAALISLHLKLKRVWCHICCDSIVHGLRSCLSMLPQPFRIEDLQRVIKNPRRVPHITPPDIVSEIVGA